MYCSYYQARVQKETTWLLVAALRSCEHCAFDRTIDKANGIIEFFVPEGFEARFLALMNYFQNRGMVSDLQKIENRLLDPMQAV